jgi:serine/threonine protein kinase
MGDTLSPDSLISHYRILSKLGEGGMAQVYLAQDMKLGRRVAIKFLPPETSKDPQARKRLVREAQAAATLEHQNICAVYEVGESDGHTFIVMQYVEGKTLHEFLNEQSPLDLPTVLSLAKEVADALAEAHSHGIVHRDLKPQNIMITRRKQAKVMDFGLAKVLEGADVVESEAETKSLLTAPGMVIGTMPYMSPEQVRGERVDERSDTFSFGVVLYEMLTGHQPFAAPSGVATISAILTKEPDPIHHYNPSCPEKLERIVRKCLTKNKDRRYLNMSEVVRDLEFVGAEHVNGARSTTKSISADDYEIPPKFHVKHRRVFLVTALLVLLGTVVIAYLYTSRQAMPTSPLQIKSLAVLPLENLSGDPAQDYFADGMTEALINNLTQISGFTG